VTEEHLGDPGVEGDDQVGWNLPTYIVVDSSLHCRMSGRWRRVFVVS